MDRHVNPQLIGRITRHGQALTPFSAVHNQAHFILLLNKFETFRSWKETIKIEKAELENYLVNEDLTNAYLDVYHKQAKYYKCLIKSERLAYVYYLMVVNKKIMLAFFRPSNKPNERIIKTYL